MADLSILEGLIIKSIEGLEKESQEVIIHTKYGKAFKFYHDQDCCEEVYLSDFEADHDTFAGAKVISVEEVSRDGADDPNCAIYCESYTWTFYKIETDKGGLWMRWLGQSNGYYSEAMSFKEVK